MKKIIYYLCLVIFTQCQLQDNNTKVAEDIAIGTYTRKEGHVDGKADGIYLMKFQNGELQASDTISGITNPSYLTANKDKSVIYAVQEIADNSSHGGGLVSSFIKNQDSDDYRAVNSIKSYGGAPCYISLSNDEKFLFVANYMSVISSYEILDDGSIGDTLSVIRHEGGDTISSRQDGAHPHMIAPIPDTDYVLVSDLGANKIYHYHCDNGTLNEAASTEMTRGAGPRHFAFHQDKEVLFVLNEIDYSIEVFTVEDWTKPLRRIQKIKTIEQEPDTGTVNTAAIRIHPNGLYVYASNRGINGSEENSISVFKINDDNTLERVQVKASGGKIPRDFVISPDGQFLLIAHQNSDNIIIYHLDETTGMIGEKSSDTHVMTPVCLKFL